MVYVRAQHTLQASTLKTGLQGKWFRGNAIGGAGSSGRLCCSPSCDHYNAAHELWSCLRYR